MLRVDLEMTSIIDYLELIRVDTNLESCCVCGICTVCGVCTVCSIACDIGLHFENRWKSEISTI